MANNLGISSYQKIRDLFFSHLSQSERAGVLSFFGGLKYSDALSMPGEDQARTLFRLLNNNTKEDEVIKTVKSLAESRQGLITSMASGV